MDDVVPLARGVRLVLTGAADFQAPQRAINTATDFRYLTRPWDAEELATHTEAAIALAQNNQQQRQQAQAGSNIKTRSARRRPSEAGYRQPNPV
jgi:response regulator RpfG family c-di-GMP phosphodiesterase